MQRRLTHALALALGLAGCSTLAPLPPEVECVVDSDCDPGLVCDIDVCRDGSGKPPLAYIGLDLQEVAGGQPLLRAEIAGCDREVERSNTSPQVLSLPRRELAQRFLLGVVDTSPTPEEPEPPPLASSFTLTQDSRFGRDPLRRQLTFAPAEESDDRTVELLWPRYLDGNALPGHLDNGGYLIWETQPLPGEETAAPALRFQLLVPLVGTGTPCATDLDCCDDDDCSDPDDYRNACVPSLGECRNPFDDTLIYDYVYVTDCDRGLRGRVATVNTSLDELGPLPGASVTIRHADADPRSPMGLPRLDPAPVADRPEECAEDPDCADGLRCNTTTAQCELPLAGLTAWAGTAPDDAELSTPGQFDARVYTYCEGTPTSQPLQRSYDVTVTPPEGVGLPAVTVQADITFDPIQAGQKPTASFNGDLCVPALGATEDVELTLTADARELLEGYTCCDIDCLPRSAEDAESGPPEPQTGCNGSTSGSTPSFRVETPLVLDEAVLEAWNAPESGCVPLLQNADGSVGVLRRSGACGAAEDEDAVPSCKASLPAGTDGDPRVYDLRIESPTGSLAGSLDAELFVSEADGVTLREVPLPNRILLRGRVLLDECSPDTAPDGDCGSPGALVLAERLRMAGESEENTPGPYFHQVSTFYDVTQRPDSRAGAYVLPLDPGVWVVTALPDRGTPGGPARIFLLDLRTDASEIPRDFHLEPGVLVTVDVSSFDRQSQVIPLDTGSWRLPTSAQLTHPDRVSMPSPDDLLDLGAPGECLSADGADVGCRIRRLVSGSALPPTQIGQVRFTTRELNTDADVICP